MLRIKTNEIKERLLAFGGMFPVFAGIQDDLNVVKMELPSGQTVEISKCDHNCTTEHGGYDCNAAFTLNPGKKSGFASAQNIIQRMTRGRQGLIAARNQFLAEEFATYCAEFSIPLDAMKALRELWSVDLTEVNLFGGNPEMHPQIFSLISQLKALGFRVNLTTTGAIFLRKDGKQIADQFAQNAPHLLALSADDMEIEDLENALALDMDGLRQKWLTIPVRHGQARKFAEAIFVSRLAQQRGDFPPILFNMVVSEKNIHNIRTLMDMLIAAFPQVLLNPYPTQTSFEGGKGVFQPAELEIFERLVDWLLEQTMVGNGHITKRAHYYCQMKAILDAGRAGLVNASDMIAGRGAWKCFRSRGAGMYLQLGKRNPDHQLVQIGAQSKNQQDEPGGIPGCYWHSRTVTEHNQAYTTDEIREHLMVGMMELAAQAVAAGTDCGGCVMPRLEFNLITLERGLEPVLRPFYLKHRKRVFGF